MIIEKGGEGGIFHSIDESNWGILSKKKINMREGQLGEIYVRLYPVEGTWSFFDFPEREVPGVYIFHNSF